MKCITISHYDKEESLRFYKYFLIVAPKYLLFQELMEIDDFRFKK